MYGVGTVWYYPQGVANILSQFCMIVHRKWSIYCRTDTHHKTGKISDLGFEVVTPQGFRCKFSPTEQRLHACEVKLSCGSKVFGNTVQNSKSLYAGACHVMMQDEEDVMQITGVPEDRLKSYNNIEVMEATSKTSTKIIVEEDLIETIAQSRGKFSKRDQTKADMLR